MAISNDLEYMTPAGFWDMHELLAHRFGLEVTDSLFMYSVDPSRSFSYFEGTEPRHSRYAGWLRDLLRSGWIDVLHAYGDFDGVGGCDRRLASAALEELTSEEVRLEVWSNHGTIDNVQNLGGAHAYYQQGDQPDADAYHADLATEYGIRFCWLDWNATNDFGHDGRETVRVTARELLRQRTRADLRRVRRGRPPLVEPVSLRDGSRVGVFLRYRGPNRPDPSTLASQLSGENLDRLARIGGYAIVYQHLGCDRRTGGCMPNRAPYFPDAALAALDHVATRQREGEVLVAGPARLLRYRAVQGGLRWRPEADGRVIVVDRVEDEVLGSFVPSLEDLGGISFDTPEPDVTSLVLDGREVPVERHERGVTVPWKRLDLPPRPPERFL